MYADVGPQRPEGIPYHRRRGRGDHIMGVEPLLLPRIRYLGVTHFCTTVYYILVAQKPHFCIMTLMYYDVIFWMLMKNFYYDRFY